MKPASFEYFAPTSIDEAVDLLARGGEDTRLLAGGQSLAALMNLRLAQPQALVDIYGLDDLAWIRADDPDGVVVGAMTRQRTVERSPEVAARLPLLVAALRHVGHFQIRNRGTIGGSICHADQAAELPAVLLVCDGWVEARSLNGTRRISAADLFVGPFTTSLRADEMVTAVGFPVPPAGTGWSFLEVARRHGDFAVAGVAALVSATGRRIDRCAVAAIAVDSRPVRLAGVEEVLCGNDYSDELTEAAVVALQAEIRPTGDFHASAETKRHLAGVLLRRAIDEAFSRTDAHGGHQE
jgi:carbon-monoxide dehydrogenase medium subunit